ncbi:MAG: lipopolysaccharide biosynthesis protein [Bacteroidales bacterium]
MISLKRLASDTAVYGLSTIVARLINYLLVAYHTRVLCPEQYGIFTELYGYITFFLVLLTYGMETGFFRFSSRSDQNPNIVFTTALISLFTTSSLFFILIASNLSSVSSFMGYANNSNYVLQLVGLISIDSFMAIPFARLRYLGKAKQFALLKLSNIIFYVLISIIFLSFLPDYFAKNPNSLLLHFFSFQVDVGYIFIANLLSSLFTLCLLLPTVFSVKIRFSKKLLRSMLIYSLPLLVAGLPGIANDYLDRILFKHFYSDPTLALQQLGLYGANAKLAMLMVIFVQMFRYAAEPFFFAQSDKRDVQQVFPVVMNYFVICASFIFLFVVLYLDVFAYFTGKNFREGLGIVPIMLFANMLLGISFNLSMWYKISEKTKYAIYITFAGLFVTLVVNIIFIPIYGYYAAAWAHLLSYSTMLIISYLLGKKYYPIVYDLKTIAFYLCTALAIYAIFAQFSNFEFIPKLLVGSGLFFIFAIIVLFRERNMILELILSRGKK